eukprot:gene9963-biopygen6240
MWFHVVACGVMWFHVALPGASGPRPRGIRSASPGLWSASPGPPVRVPGASGPRPRGLRSASPEPPVRIPGAPGPRPRGIRPRQKAFVQLAKCAKSYSLVCKARKKMLPGAAALWQNPIRTDRPPAVGVNSSGVCDRKTRFRQPRARKSNLRPGTLVGKLDHSPRPYMYHLRARSTRTR